jgi:hypothetical protein
MEHLFPLFFLFILCIKTTAQESTSIMQKENRLFPELLVFLPILVLSTTSPIFNMLQDCQFIFLRNY